MQWLSVEPLAILESSVLEEYQAYLVERSIYVRLCTFGELQA
jgi:hypothetical protein